jgi:predicted NAD/FAD-binding protein
MGAAIWSTDPESMQHFPARFFVRFLHHHGLLSISDRPRWYVVEGGSREYVRPLIRAFEDRIRLNSPVESVRRFATHVEITPRHRPTERFDAVFIAAHSDQALTMLEDPSPLEREVLGAIRYQENEAVLHTDHSILPARRRAWAAWNYHIRNEPGERVAVTYNMNILQGLDAPVQFCVTLNNSRAVNPRSIIDRVNYHHPLFTPETVAAQNRQREINGINKTFYCGAYWRNGFHEDGVVSAQNALQHFDETYDEQLHIRRAG